jgi:hypothetical protein
MVMQAAATGPGAARRTVTPADRLAGAGHHWSRGKGSAQPQSRLVGAERGNSDEVQAVSGKPTVRKAQSLGGNRMAQEANAGRPKGQGKVGRRRNSCRVSRITRRIRAQVARSERTPTWAW